MASGRSHDRAGLYGSIALGAYLFSSGVIMPVAASWMLAGYGVGIIWLSPDLDLKQSRPSKRWGLLQFLNRPYSSMISHRGISHMPILGTLTRAIYLLPLFFLFPDRVFIVSVLIGLELSALTHLFMDYAPIFRRM